MGLAAMGTLIYTKGNISMLVVMYSINVFITFSISMAAMIKHTYATRKEHSDWRQNILVHVLGFLLCFSILTVMVIDKIGDGGSCRRRRRGGAWSGIRILPHHHGAGGLGLPAFAHQVLGPGRAPVLA